MRESRIKKRADKADHMVLDLREKGAVKALMKEGLKLHVGQRFAIILSENPSTGYKWLIDQKGANGTFMISQQFSPASEGDQMMGASGIKKVYLVADN